MIKNNFRSIRATNTFVLLMGVFVSCRIWANETSSHPLQAYGGDTFGRRPNIDSEPYIPPKSAVQRHDLKNEFIRGFKLQIISEKFIRLSFETNDSKCYGSRAVLEETDDTVGVAVVTGTLPEAAQVCALEGHWEFFELHLQREIGYRKVFKLKTVNLNQ